MDRLLSKLYLIALAFRTSGNKKGHDLYTRKSLIIHENDSFIQGKKIMLN